MEKRRSRRNEAYCTFCENTEMLKEFKAVYVCSHCIEEAKSIVKDKEIK